jgi:hypothetical protein
MLAVKSSCGGFTSPYVYAIPANTVIFYNGTYSAAVNGWTLYSAAANSLIVGTATQSEVAVATAASGSTVVQAGTLSTAGLHIGTQVASTGGSGTYDTSFVSAGDHTHTVTPSSITISTEMKPVSTTVTMLQTTTEQKFFPANTIHIGATNLFSGTQKLATTSDRYISGGSAITDNPSVDHTATFTVSSYSSSSHTHMAAGSSYRTGASTGSSHSAYTTGNSASHTHTLTATAQMTALRGKLLKLWITATRQLPKNSLVVMYCGDLSQLPSYWKVCDGNNGTVDMQGYFLGYATSAATAHGTITSATTTYSTSGPTIASNDYSHEHYSVSTSIYSTLYRPHALESFPHTHTLATQSLTTDAFPANIKLAFIQLVI